MMNWEISYFGFGDSLCYRSLGASSEAEQNPDEAIVI